MDSSKLLKATTVSHEKREKRKKLSDNAATDRDFSAFVLQGDVAWLDNVENDRQRKTAVCNWPHLPDARKTEKIE